MLLALLLWLNIAMELFALRGVWIKRNGIPHIASLFRPIIYRRVNIAVWAFESYAVGIFLPVSWARRVFLLPKPVAFFLNWVLYYVP